MNVTITGRHLEITDGIKSHISSKVEKLTKYAKKIDTVNIILSVEKYRHSAEAIVSAYGTSFTSKEVTEDMYSSVDTIFNKIESQFRKYKEKRDSKSRKGAVRLHRELAVEVEQTEDIE